MELNKIYNMDCLEGMKKMESDSVDTIITDPPYGLSFMGKKWDYDVPSVEVWKECLRVLKPGGTALIFAGSRTQHRMAVNVEDAGFILKDCIMWLYGSGFPKATDISKQLDKLNGKYFNEGFKQYLIDAKKKSGKTLKDINILLGYSDKGGNFASDLFSFKKGNRFLYPTIAQYEKLKIFLNLDNKYDELVKIEEAEREVIGKDGRTAKESVFGMGIQEEWDLTKSSTPEAQLWNGWKSHGLKPAYEPVIWATKSFKKSEDFPLLERTNNLLGELLWKQIVRLEKMDMFKSQEKVLISLNTVLLWNSILEELLKKENKSIILTESKVITELKTLNLLLSKNTQESTDGESQTCQSGIPKSQANGFTYLAKIVKSYLGKERKSLSDIQKVIVQEVATFKEKEPSQYDMILSAKNVEKDLFTNVLIVNSVLLNVITKVVELKEEKELIELASFVEKSLKLYHQDQPSSAMLDVCQKDIRKVVPDFSPILVAMKPNDGTYANNALKHGVSGLNIDGGRIGTDIIESGRANRKETNSVYKDGLSPQKEKQFSQGRFPANIILDEEAGAMLDEQTGILPTGGFQKGSVMKNKDSGKEICGMYKGQTRESNHSGDKGGASRFFYCAKASKSERNKGCDEKTNTHPTVKPLKLMEYLCTLTKTPTGGIVLDPFCGSGTTLLAAKRLGRSWIGFELSEEYVKIVNRRLSQDDSLIIYL